MHSLSPCITPITTLNLNSIYNNNRNFLISPFSSIDHRLKPISIVLNLVSTTCSKPCRSKTPPSSDF
ncbi:hypothetical protein TSUD_74520 [Trifolium subterraneum]|nr:hypothetical protein TSUD_74520 [Trifolium subterraneum]